MQMEKAMGMWSKLKTENKDLATSCSTVVAARGGLC